MPRRPPPRITEPPLDNERGAMSRGAAGRECRYKTELVIHLPLNEQRPSLGLQCRQHRWPTPSYILTNEKRLEKFVKGVYDAETHQSGDMNYVYKYQTSAALRVVETGTCVRRVKHRKLGTPHTVVLSSDKASIDYQSRHAWYASPSHLPSAALRVVETGTCVRRVKHRKLGTPHTVVLSSDKASIDYQSRHAWYASPSHLPSAALRVVETGTCVRRVKHRKLGTPHTVVLSSDKASIDYQSRHAWYASPSHLPSAALRVVETGTCVRRVKHRKLGTPHTVVLSSDKASIDYQSRHAWYASPSHLPSAALRVVETGTCVRRVKHRKLGTPHTVVLSSDKASIDYQSRHAWYASPSHLPSAALRVVETGTCVRRVKHRKLGTPHTVVLSSDKASIDYQSRHAWYASPSHLPSAALRVVETGTCVRRVKHRKLGTPHTVVLSSDKASIDYQSRHAWYASPSHLPSAALRVVETGTCVRRVKHRKLGTPHTVVLSSDKASIDYQSRHAWYASPSHLPSAALRVVETGTCVRRVKHRKLGTPHTVVLSSDKASIDYQSRHAWYASPSHLPSAALRVVETGTCVRRVKHRKLGTPHTVVLSSDKASIDYQSRHAWYASPSHLPSAALRVVETGTCVRRVKHRKLGTPHTVVLSSDKASIDYQSRHAWSCVPDRLKSVRVSELLEVREGWATDNFHKASKRKEFTDSVKERCCFSVVFRHPILFHKSLDLVSDSEEEARAWVLALRHLLAKAKMKNLHFNEEQWLREEFRKADTNKSGTLTFGELWVLLRGLNLELSEEYGRAIFAGADVNKTSSQEGGPDDALDVEEFLKFFRFLTQRKDLEAIMQQWSQAKADVLFPEDLQRFLTEAQGFPGVTKKEAEDLIKQFEPEEAGEKRAELVMGPNGFRRLLLSKWGALQMGQDAVVWQDMDQPMTSYFINSSHNTYLVSGQLRGEASVEGYIHALKKGARLVELDVWDGPEGEPVLTHGHTLVEPILLADACAAIAKYAFVRSAFPLLLSIENHCSVPQQSRMAAIFRKAFGSALLIRRFHKEERMPSPRELGKRIMVKAKRLPGFVVPIAETVVDGGTGQTETLEVGEVSESEDDDDVTMDDSSEPPEPKEKKKVKIAQEFSDVVAVTGAKLHDLAKDLAEHLVDSFVSVGESRMLGHMAADPQGLVRYSARHFVKSYPKGLRTDSSNMEPVSQWAHGVQVVTMNMQTAGEEMDLNQAFFRQNAGCGYVLKPQGLRDGSLDLASIAHRDPTVFTIKVISGQYLPRPETGDASDVIDPYVSVEVKGWDHSDSVKHHTEVVRNNGFNPTWNETFELSVRAPELAVLRLTVKDHDKTSYNDFIGQYSVPLHRVRKGYAHLTLCTGFDHSDDPSARLFVHMDRSDQANNNNN